MNQEIRRLRVSNWDQYQHYRNRRPPWIKLHVALLDDYEFTRLQPASRLLAICSMLLAAKTENHIPGDPSWISEALHLSEPPDIESLITSGFLTVCDCERCTASKTLADCKQSARAETETETETDSSSEDGTTPRSDSEIALEVFFPVIRKKKNGPRQWGLPAAKVAEWEECYPGLDIHTEVRRARQWLLDNPTRQKTPRGMPRFLNAWLERNQNRGSGLFAKQQAEQRAEAEAVAASEARVKENNDPHSPTRHGIKHTDGRIWCSRSGGWIQSEEWRPLDS